MLLAPAELAVQFPAVESQVSTCPFVGDVTSVSERSSNVLSDKSSAEVSVVAPANWEIRFLLFLIFLTKEESSNSSTTRVSLTIVGYVLLTIGVLSIVCLMIFWVVCVLSM